MNETWTDCGFLSIRSVFLYSKREYVAFVNALPACHHHRFSMKNKDAVELLTIITRLNVKKSNCVLKFLYLNNSMPISVDRNRVKAWWNQRALKSCKDQSIPLEYPAVLET